jgi:hypothetical protein
MTNKLKVHKQQKIIISIVYCLSIYFDENIMLAMVFFVSTCNNKLQLIFPSEFDSKSTEKSNIEIIVDTNIMRFSKVQLACQVNIWFTYLTYRNVKRGRPTAIYTSNCMCTSRFMLFQGTTAHAFVKFTRTLNSLSYYGTSWEIWRYPTRCRPQCFLTLEPLMRAISMWNSPWDTNLMVSNLFFIQFMDRHKYKTKVPSYPN